MKKLSLLILGTGFLINVAWADFLFSSDVGFSVGANSFNKYDVVSTNGSGSYNTVLASLSAALPPETNIDALQSISSNTTVFSLGSDAVIQGTLFHKQDLIVWNGTTATLLWDGQANGLPAETNLDAVDVSNLSPSLTFSFSLSEGANLSGIGQVTKSDAIHWNGSAFSGKDFDAEAQYIPGEVNLDTYLYVSGTQRIMSFDSQAYIPSTTTNLFDKSDLISFNPSSNIFSSYFDSASNSIPPEINIVAVDVNIGVLVPVELSRFETE